VSKKIKGGNPMLSHEEIEKIRRSDFDKMDKFSKTADNIATKKTSAMQENIKNLKKKYSELIDEKAELFRSPLTIAETLKLAKDALRKARRKWFFEERLVSHIKAVQMRQSLPFDPLHLRLLFDFNPDEIWKLALWIISEGDLEEAAKMLPPDVGMTSEEMNEKIKKIDKEIEGIESQIEKELKKV
jgi:hypothetical protein